MKCDVDKFNRRNNPARIVTPSGGGSSGSGGSAGMNLESDVGMLKA